MNRKRKNETGTALAITLMILLILTIIGMAALMTSSLDLKITGNEQLYKKAFYAADAGLNYAQYNMDYVSLVPNPGAIGVGVPFSMGGSGTGIVKPADQPQFTNAGIDFEGTVTYQSSGPVPEGPVVSGTDFVAYHFQVDCTGKGPGTARADLRMHGYIVGYK